MIGLQIKRSRSKTQARQRENPKTANFRARKIPEKLWLHNFERHTLWDYYEPNCRWVQSWTTVSQQKLFWWEHYFDFILFFDSIKRNISPILTSSNSPVHVSKYDQIMFSTYRNNGPVAPLANNPIVTSTNGMGKTVDQNVLSPTQTIDNDDYVPMLTKDSSPGALSQWLNFHRLNAYANTFAHFSGSDLLR